MPIIECNDKGTFDRELKNAKSKLVVIDFHATWCGPCKMIAPKYAEFSNKYAQSCVFLKVDVDKNREAAQECKVEAMPTFAFFHELRMIDTMKGADPGKLETLIKKYSEQYSKYAFKGQGNVLGHATAGAATKNEPAKPAAGTATSGPPRRNPWADPNFMPKSSSSSAAPTTTSSTPAKPTTSNPAADKWANKDLSKPATPAAAPAPAATTTPSKPAPAPLPHPSASAPATTPTPATATTTDTTPTPSTASTTPSTPAPTGHDPRLTVNAVLLQQLMDMGFTKIRSEKALILTKNVSVENAMNWLLEHESDADIDEPLQVVGTSSNVKGAPLGVQQDDSAILSNPDLTEEEKQILLAAKANAAAKPATAMSAPVASGDKKVSEMTSEEKMQWLAKKREDRKIRLEKEAFEKQRTSERSRVAINKAAGDMKEKMEEEAAKAAYAKKKKEEKEAAEARKRIKEKLAQDKARRQKEREEELANLAKQKAAAAAAAGAKK